MKRIKWIKGNPYWYEQRSVRLKNGQVKTKTIRYIGRASDWDLQKLGITPRAKSSAAGCRTQVTTLAQKKKKRKF